jgi:2-methylcitrate dehydratase
MVAVPMIFGELKAESYEDSVAADPRIDALRDKMEVRENEAFTRDYFDPEKRGIGNAIEVFFNDGSSTERVQIDYPVGHRRRREEGIPLLMEKFQAALGKHYGPERVSAIQAAVGSQESLERLSVSEFVDAWVVGSSH